jgi:hypothetical protein
VRSVIVENVVDLIAYIVGIAGVRYFSAVFQSVTFLDLIREE